MANETSVLMVAGERSGDVYGGQLARALRRTFGPLSIFGCGGEAMAQAGVESVVDVHAFSMVGITEVIAGMPRAIRAFGRLLAETDRRRPELAVLIDSPSLNMKLAKRLKRRGIKVVYFVSPQIWAWKKWRLRQLRPRVDKMLCILDFEEAIYRDAGIPVQYVGHPLAETLPERADTAKTAFANRWRLDPCQPIVALLPGSRQIEIKYNLPVMLQACRRLSVRRQVQFLLAAPPGVDPKWLESQVRANLPLRFAYDATQDALRHSKCAAIASGTATLEAALVECPMVVVYRVARLTAFFARWMLDVPFYSLVNLLAGKRVVPELIQEDFTAANLARELESLLDDSAARSWMIDEFHSIRRRLGYGGAIERAARAVAEMLGKAASRAGGAVCEATSKAQI